MLVSGDMLFVLSNSHLSAKYKKNKVGNPPPTALTLDYVCMKNIVKINTYNYVCMRWALELQGIKDPSTPGQQ